MADRDAGRQTIIFISRAGEDADFAAEIGRILRGAGYRVILQQGDFDNQNFMHKIHEALDLSRHVIALLSPDYMESDYCELEWTATLAHDPLNRRGRLIVMRIADCTPKGILAALAYWDLVPIRGDAATTREVALMAVRADMQKLDAEAACPFFHRASWPFLLSQKIVHREEIHDVPIFTGRKAELEALRDTLHKKGGTAALTNSKSAALHGLGGVGKTTLARKYAWDEQENYCGVWWIGAQKHEGLVGDLVKLGKELFPGIQHMRDPGRPRALFSVLSKRASSASPGSLSTITLKIRATWTDGLPVPAPMLSSPAAGRTGRMKRQNSCPLTYLRPV